MNVDSAQASTANDDLSLQAKIASTQQLLELAAEEFPPGSIALSFSGAEDVILIDLLHKLGTHMDVFSLDTGRLPSETHEFFETVRNHYDLPIELISPEPKGVGTLVKTKGLFSFYQDGHQECCDVRKVQPLREKLATLNAWVTGQRQDQSVTRSSIPPRQLDDMFSTTTNALTKFNPLAEWTSMEVWHYIRANQVPYNSLHDQGFLSLGCQPCTRAIGPHEHERAGRWWWEEATKKECGLHQQNTIPLTQTQ